MPNIIADMINLPLMLSLLVSAKLRGVHWIGTGRCMQISHPLATRKGSAVHKAMLKEFGALTAFAAASGSGSLEFA